MRSAVHSDQREDHQSEPLGIAKDLVDLRVGPRLVSCKLVRRKMRVSDSLLNA